MGDWHVFDVQPVIAFPSALNCLAPQSLQNADSFLCTGICNKNSILKKKRRVL